VKRLSEDVRQRVAATLARRDDAASTTPASTADAGETASAAAARAAADAVYDSLVAALTPGGAAPPGAPSQPFLGLDPGGEHVVLLVGLQGAGKTTTAVKLAAALKKRGLRPGLLCADTFRAGALDQLRQGAARVGVPFWGRANIADPAAAVVEGLAALRAAGRRALIVDTSGRHHAAAALFEEMRAVASVAAPTLTLLVVDGRQGQGCAESAAAFADALRGDSRVGGVVVTKLDGGAATGRGGGALSAAAAAGAPVALVGTGERVDALEEFHPGRFVSRLLGRGDLEGLAAKFRERAEAESRAAAAGNAPGRGEGVPTSGLALMSAVAGGRLTLRQFRDQFSGIASMGSMSQLMGMLPGLASAGSGGRGCRESYGRRRDLGAWAWERLCRISANNRPVPLHQNCIPPTIRSVHSPFRARREVYSGPWPTPQATLRAPR